MVNYLIYGDHDDNTKEQMALCMATGSAAAGVLCADGHLGYSHPIGGVVGYTDHISISGVGFDIACGNMAVRLDVPYSAIKDRIPEILQAISAVVSFGVGRINEDERVEHELFDSDLWEVAGVQEFKSTARAQLGTVGSGNHYVDLFEDEAGWVWIGVHFGSRGLGHKTTTKYLAAMGAKDEMISPPALVPVGTDLAVGYLAGVELGGLYAYAGREWVIDRVRKIVGGNVTETVHNHHNFVWLETHNGQAMWVVRKGATPAFPGQMGFVGGSMGDNAVILKGVDSAKSAASLYSTVHGAGRVMSRTAARGRSVKDPVTGKRERQPGLVRHDEWMAWLARTGVHLVGSDLDEAPQAYRRLPEVLEAHAGTIEIVHDLRPVGVIMAGARVVDPYKD